MFACKSDFLSKKDLNKFIPDVIGNEELNESQLVENNPTLPETSFENATVQDIETYYRKIMNRGAVYFVGFETTYKSSAVESASLEVPEMTYSFFVTGSILDQLTTVALKTQGKLYQLNDDFYIVKSVDENVLSTFNTSSVFVSNCSSEDIKRLLSLYKLDGESFGLQTVARGSLLDLLAFDKTFKMLSQNNSVYLIDLAFIDFTIDEAAKFEAFLQVKHFDLLNVSSFNDLFSVYLDTSVDNLRSRNFYSQCLLASDGMKSTFNVGVTHSREERAITDQGTSTVSKYDDVKDGFQLSFTPQKSIGQNVICTLELENSVFTDESYNTKSETNLNVQSVPFQLGKTYYISSLTNIDRKRSISLFGIDLSTGHRVQTCWCRVRKIK